MSIQFQPREGSILICDFDGYRKPEICKRRPVVVLASFPNKLCIVIPLSTTEPWTVQKWHYNLRINPPLPTPSDSEYCWAKGDLVTHVSWGRLRLPFKGKDANGKRKYVSYCVDANELEALRTCVLEAISS